MERDGSGVSALVGLDEFVVTAQLFDDDSGEWFLAIETTRDGAWCESCAVRAIGHGRRRVVVRDLPMAGRPVRLVWAKRLWRCGEPTCPARTWSEESDEIAPRAVLTERARAEICRRVGPAQPSVAQAARDFGVSWHAAMAAVRDHGRPRIDHLARLGAPSAVGLEETSFLAATADHPTLLVTGIIDLDAGRLIDVLPARSAVAVTNWLGSKPAPWLAGIRHVVIDPYQPYASAVADGLPEARLVVSEFATQIPVGLANICGSRVGLGQALLPMVGEASEAGGFEAGLSGFANGGTPSLMFVVGGDVANPGMQADVVVVLADDGELGAQQGRVGDLEQVGPLGFDVSEQ